MLDAAALEDREDVGVALVVDEDADCIVSVSEMSSGERELLGDVGDGVRVRERVSEGSGVVLSVGGRCM